MLGLVLEGGASRTVYSCGIMDTLLKNGIVADYVIGVSAGAAFGISYVSNQIGRNLTLATKYMGTPEYMGMKHMLNPKNKCYYNLEYAYNEVPNNVLPFDYEAYKRYKGKFYAVVTNVESGEAEYYPVPRDDTSWQLLRATCALPLLFPKIELNGEYYLDGGIADSIPYKQAIKAGCDKLIIVLTRPKSYVKTTDGFTKLAQKYYRHNPKLAAALGSRAERYNQCTAEIEEMRKQGKAFVFTPKSVFGVGRTENEPQKLERLYTHGLKHCEWAMDDLKKYISH